MKKSLLLYGVFLCALSLSSCSGNTKNKQVVDSSMNMESANEVIKYYDISLKVLKGMVKEDDIKAILGYLDKTGGVDSLPLMKMPITMSQDTAFVAHPGNFFNEDERQNLEDNYTRLFRTVSAFYENYETYRIYMKDKAYKDDNYALADKIRKEELLLSIALSEYKQVIFDILSPVVEDAKTSLAAIQNEKKK